LARIIKLESTFTSKLHQEQGHHLEHAKRTIIVYMMSGWMLMKKMN